MTRELTINGQAVDLLPDTDITLEYTSGFFEEPGKINLPRSYTVKLPRTARNTSILDAPGQPGHESGATRRFLSARFYRNGIDLLGETKAYIMRTSPEGYEIALVWNALDALQTLSQSDATINDLPDLPVLPWIGANGVTPNYVGNVDGALFAWYNSGLGAMRYPAVPTSTHPSMEVGNLLERILTGAGVPYEVSDAAMDSLSNLVVLAAPGHAPDLSMELASGSVAESVEFRSATVNNQPSTLLYMQAWSHGWDAPSDADAASSVFYKGEVDTHHVILNLRAPEGVDMSDCSIAVYGQISEDNMITDQAELLRAFFRESSSGWTLYIDADINLSGWPEYAIRLYISRAVSAVMSTYKQGLPMFAAYRVHASIDISQDNRFPIAGNLPDLKQWDFIRSCAALLGWVLVIKQGTLHISTWGEIFAEWRAYNWTDKVDMMNHAPQEVKYTLDKWARVNLITYEDDAPLGYDPTGVLEVHDDTISAESEYYSLPYAASRGSDAVHYSIKDENEVEYKDMASRIFRVIQGDIGHTLTFSDDLYGEGLIASRYARLQGIIRTPVCLSVNIRLNELDLASLDLTRAVYLEQYGRYYAIIKIQTSATDLCKVELIQLP